jgi:nucleoid DNA-binding protein
MVLAAAIANLAPGDPVWLLLVGPPSAGKTEVVSPLVRMPWAHSAATLTEAALLSGTPKREVHASAKGGLLREVGDFGVLVMKDFTSILAQNRDTQAQVLAALREVFDGSWTRHVGTDGGRTLHWEGKLGLIAGCTPTIDQHHAVIGSMGNRFVFHRLPTDDADADKVAEGALSHSGHESAMRADLANAVAEVLAAASGTNPRELTVRERVRLGGLSVFATACRTAVERDPHTREVLAVPEREGPARFVGQLRLLLHGLESVGVGPTDTWRLLAKLAMDAMPAGRLAVLRYLRGASAALGSGDIASAVGLPTVTARRCLEDLALLGAVDRSKAGSHYNAADLWEISPWAVGRWPVETVPDNPDKEIERDGHPSLSVTRTHTDGYSGTARTAPDRTTPAGAISAESAQSGEGAALPRVGSADPLPSGESASPADPPKSGAGVGTAHAAGAPVEFGQ